MKHRVRIKMCGMTRREDIAHAHALGVDAIGLIFHPQSPRAVTLEQAAALFKPVPAFMHRVGVFVNPDIQTVQHAISRLPLTMLQFHGEENEAFCATFGLPYIKSISADRAGELKQLAQQYASAEGLLIDTPCGEQRGGSGKSFDWQSLPQNLSLPIILAGGLHAENVKQAVKEVNPLAVDVCSGVEARHGIKDHQKMNAFVRAVGEL